MTDDEWLCWWCMNDDGWWMMDDGWWMMGDGWWMMDDVWLMIYNGWWMMDDGCIMDGFFGLLTTLYLVVVVVGKKRTTKNKGYTTTTTSTTSTTTKLSINLITHNYNCRNYKSSFKMWTLLLFKMFTFSLPEHSFAVYKLLFKCQYRMSNSQ